MIIGSSVILSVIYISVFLLWQMISAIMLFLSFQTKIRGDFVEYILAALLGSMHFLDGGILYVIFGLGLYITRKNKINLSITMFVFPILYTLLFYLNIIPRILGKLGRMGFRDLSELLEIPFIFLLNYVLGGIKDNSLMYDTYYWCMIFALPFMMLYNGKDISTFFICSIHFT